MYAQDSSGRRPAQPETSRAPGIVAIGVVLDGGRVLVGRRERPPFAGYAEFPGGKTLPGESPEAAVVREVLEECGLVVRVVSLLARERTRHRSGEPGRRYQPDAADLHFFLCRLAKTGAARPPRADDDPRRPFAWIPLEQLGDFSFPPPNERVLEQLRRLTRRG